MDKNIDKIIEEIVNLDPDLIPHKDELRNIVLLLQQSKPDVSIDQQFISELRSRLLAQAGVKNYKRNIGFSWWLSRASALGFVAVMIFLLAPSQKDMAVPSTLSEPFEESSKSRMMQSVDSTMGISENSLNISEQTVGNRLAIDFVTLKRAGFVAVHEDNNGKFGKIIGVSGLLYAGRTINITVDLFVSLKEGKNYYAVLYSDNGDEEFSASSDSTIKDSITGEPMHMIFTAIK